MTPISSEQDSAFPIMTMDILKNVLSRADDPGELGKYLTEEIREITGARCVLLVRHYFNNGHSTHHVDGISPERNLHWAESPDTFALYSAIKLSDEATVWSAEVTSDTAQLLSQQGFPLSLTVPLLLGESRMGSLLALGLPDQIHIKQVLSLLDTLSTIVALVLKNANFFELQEQVIKERTEELRESEVRFRNAIVNAPFPIMIHAEDGKVEMLNDEWAQITGYSLADIPTIADWTEKAYGNRMEVVRADIDRLYSITGKVDEGEYLISTKSGEKRYWYFSSTSLGKSADGRRIAMSMALDMTERIQTENHYKLILQTTMDGFWITDSNGKIIEVNDAYCEMSGYTRDELLTKHIADLDRFESPTAVSQRMEKIIKDGYVFFESQHCRKNNDIIDVEVSTSYLKESARFCVFVRNISERKLADETLQRERDRAQHYLNIASVMLIAFDTEGRITLINKRGLEILGYDMEDILGRNWFDLCLPSPMQEDVRGIFAELMTGNIELVEYYENPVLTNAGQERIIAFHNSILKDSDNRITGILSSGEDITERKHLEEQLRQSQKMEAIGQLAGGVAHDFNNILTVIMGYANLLGMGKALDNHQKEAAEQIIAASEKAAQLTSGLLAFSRKQVLQPKMANLNDIVQLVHKFIARVIGEHIQFKHTINQTDIPVVVDSGQIEQALINLATNARDAMPNGGVLSIETGLQDIEDSLGNEYGNIKPGRYACITISDTGSGMDEETRSRIFEPFFTTKEVGKGTGLGMAIVYGIVQQHNGFINVYSEPGQGTTFRIYIPLAEREHQGKEEKPLQVVPRGGSETILLAEDDATVRKLVMTILTKFGYNVIEAEDGQDAVEKFSAHSGKISLILMDMIMPKKNGREAFEEISKIKPDVKVLYSSGYTADFIKNRGVDEEGIELIMKPVQPMELLRKIREMLDR